MWILYSWIFLLCAMVWHFYSSIWQAAELVKGSQRKLCWFSVECIPKKHMVAFYELKLTFGRVTHRDPRSLFFFIFFEINHFFFPVNDFGSQRISEPKGNSETIQSTSLPPQHLHKFLCTINIHWASSRLYTNQHMWLCSTHLSTF